MVKLNSEIRVLTEEMRTQAEKKTELENDNKMLTDELAFRKDAYEKVHCLGL